MLERLTTKGNTYFLKKWGLNGTYGSVMISEGKLKGRGYVNGLFSLTGLLHSLHILTCIHFLTVSVC